MTQQNFEINHASKARKKTSEIKSWFIMKVKISPGQNQIFGKVLLGAFINFAASF
jgi:hypothetical protein